MFDSIYAEQTTIFETKLNKTSDCNSKNCSKNKKLSLISLPLPQSTRGEFTKYAETDVVHLEKITDSYMALVESSTMNGNSCLTNYTAVVIKNDGSILANKFTKTSGTCHIDRAITGSDSNCC